MLTKLHLQDMKADLVSDASHGRVSSTLELEESEMDDLILHLTRIQDGMNRTREAKKVQENKKEDQMRKKILHYCHMMRWYKEGTDKLDWDRINNFCEKYGYHHKQLNQYNLAELRILVTQFEQVYKHFLQKI